MSISNENKKQYRLVGHDLKPVVTVAGKGLTPSVITEINRALDDHELIKAKIAITDREIRKEVVKEICLQLKAETVQEIGKVVLLFRPSDKPTLKTSNIR